MNFLQKILHETYRSYRGSDEDFNTVFRFCYGPLSGPKIAKNGITSERTDKTYISDTWNGPVVLKTQRAKCLKQNQSLVTLK